MHLLSRKNIYIRILPAIGLRCNSDIYFDPLNFVSVVIVPNLSVIFVCSL